MSGSEKTKKPIVSYNGGIDIFGLLLVLFVGLKLTGHIDWSWWWVTVPLWGPVAFIGGLFVLFFPVWLWRRK